MLHLLPLARSVVAVLAAGNLLIVCHDLII